jgi:hypothetical protein
MHFKIHRSYRSVVTLCDADLIGKKFEEGIRQLDVRENFYKGDEVEQEEAIRLLQLQAREDSTFNIVGKESTETAVIAGIIKKNHVSSVGGVPFALTLL